MAYGGCVGNGYFNNRMNTLCIFTVLAIFSAIVYTAISRKSLDLDEANRDTPSVSEASIAC